MEIYNNPKADGSDKYPSCSICPNIKYIDKGLHERIPFCEAHRVEINDVVSNWCKIVEVYVWMKEHSANEALKLLNVL